VDPVEREPTKGRMLVFQVTESKPHLSHNLFPRLVSLWGKRSVLHEYRRPGNDIIVGQLHFRLFWKGEGEGRLVPSCELKQATSKVA